MASPGAPMAARATSHHTGRRTCLQGQPSEAPARGSASGSVPRRSRGRPEPTVRNASLFAPPTQPKFAEIRACGRQNTRCYMLGGDQEAPKSIGGRAETGSLA